MERTIELGRLWDRILARRRAIGMLVCIVTLLTAIVAFVMPPWYRAEASLMPPSEDVNFGLGSLLKGVGVPGVKLATQAAPSEVFQAILQSRRVNLEIIRRFDLQKLYKRKYLVDTLRELKTHTRFTVDDVGVINIAVEDRDPKRAADMANAYFEILDHLNREVRVTRGRRTRIFVGARLDSTRQALASAEERLARYEATHKSVALSSQASTAIEAAARHYANRAALEVRLGVLRSTSRETTDEERQIMNELAQLDRQLGSLPGVNMDLGRLVREVQTQQQLYLLLVAQYEDARISEARDVPTVEPLDEATPPERKSRPKRLSMIGLAFLFSLAGGAVYAVMQDEGSAGAPESATVA